MLIDNALAMSNAQVVTATGNSSDYIDHLGSANLGADRVPRVGLNISAVTGTSPTLTAKLVGADDAAFSTNKVTIGAIVDAITAAGNYRIPVGNVARKRYYRIEYTVGGTTPSFTVTSFVVMDDQAILTP